MTAFGVVFRVLGRFLTHPVVRAAAVEALRAGTAELLSAVQRGKSGKRRSGTL